ncbi:trehalose 6-phosphate phosphatase [Kribbella orskensis]|uniref:Trehalose 6-phosphate phosphatase n=1 Tax=Kribbella orskensis TaxID=2512216 RepID=A0ABY2BWA9_9ACTN|nr:MULTISPECIES: trehalose-phosphatase [Kribbella]TCN43944.1 trehalose 6-phosphate phosphatase [Kribbella sp. VKM Ac-2500]TCO32278.1 trehalose 6-phosphate phosphatase [Kribbella orskensis]
MSTPVLATAAGREGWEAIVEDPAGAVIASDFDGTLSPLVEDPAMSRAADGALDALARLARSVGQVAIVTGRPALVATELSGVSGHPGLGRLVVLGHYGLERWEASTGAVTSDPVPPGVAVARERLPGLLQEAGLPDAFVEDKGSSLAVHTRRLPEPLPAWEALRAPLTELAESTDLRLEPGNLVLELRPPGIDKGVAMRRLVESTEARSVLYAGDDLGDLAAFRALDDLRGEGLHAVLVAARSGGSSELADAADIVVDDPAGVVTVLTALSDAIATR